MERINKPEEKEKVSGFKKFFYFLGQKGLGSFVSALICVLLGVLVGFIVMLCIDAPNALKGLKALFMTALTDRTSIARMLYVATPMILTGVSISFAFQLGLFNIGITGQVTIGAFVSIVLGILGCNWVVCILAATLAGAIIGFLPGFLKAKFNVNEVLSGIMLNWIVYYVIGLIGNMVLPSSFKDRNTPSNLINMPKNGRLPTLGLDKILPGVSIGLFIAILLAIVFQVILHHTKFGFELKLSGSNKFAAKYAGINQTKNIILSLTISGALAGMAGYMLYANPLNPVQFQWDSGSNTLISDGFTGISVSLIAQNSSIGCILSACLLSILKASDSGLVVVSSAYNVHYTELIISLIIYFASFSSFIGLVIRWLMNRKDNPVKVQKHLKHCLTKGLRV